MRALMALIRDPLQGKGFYWASGLALNGPN